MFLSPALRLRVPRFTDERQRTCGNPTVTGGTRSRSRSTWMEIESVRVAAGREQRKSTQQAWKSHSTSEALGSCRFRAAAFGHSHHCYDISCVYTRQARPAVDKVPPDCLLINTQSPQIARTLILNLASEANVPAVRQNPRPNGDDRRLPSEPPEWARNLKSAEALVGARPIRVHCGCCDVAGGRPSSRCSARRGNS